MAKKTRGDIIAQRNRIYGYYHNNPSDTNLRRYENAIGIASSMLRKANAEIKQRQSQNAKGNIAG